MNTINDQIVEKKVRDDQALQYEKNRRKAYLRWFEILERHVLLRCLRGYEGKEVLDAGGGTGRLIQYILKKSPGAVLLDFSREELKIARQKVGNLKVIQGDIRDLPFQSSFDCIICTDVLQHIPKENLVQVFNNFKSGLKNEGELIFTIWNANSFQTIFEANPYGTFASGIPYRSFNERSLSELFRECNFTPTFWRGMGYCIYAVRKVRFTTKLYNLLGWLTFPLELILTRRYNPAINKYAMHHLIIGTFN